MVVIIVLRAAGQSSNITELGQSSNLCLAIKSTDEHPVDPHHEIATSFSLFFCNLGCEAHFDIGSCGNDGVGLIQAV
eukprot:scaffold219518_cov34-Prasinocladus_malaysianus.AAC.1